MFNLIWIYRNNRVFEENLEWWVVLTTYLRVANFFFEFGFCRGEPVNWLNLIVTCGAVFTYCFTLCFHHNINLFSFMVI